MQIITFVHKEDWYQHWVWAFGEQTRYNLYLCILSVPFILVLCLLILYIVLYLRCFDTVFQRPYRYFSIALKVVFSLSDRYKIFTSYWLWIEICENVVLSKIDITMTTVNKNFEIDKSRILCDLDLLLKVQH